VAIAIGVPGPGDVISSNGEDSSGTWQSQDAGHLLSTMENVDAAIAVLDAASRINDHNRSFVEQCGRTADTLLGCDICELLHPSVRGVMARQFDRLIQRRTHSFVENLTALWEGSTTLSGTVTASANQDAGGRVESILIMINAEETGGNRRTLISPTKLLSKINAQILEGVAAGASTVQLASRLYLSRQGVEYHVGNMLRQFKVPNRAALVSKSYSMGLFKVGSWPPQVLPDYVRP
jgi:PAS domain S-box-containing protein